MEQQIDIRKTGFGIFAGWMVSLAASLLFMLAVALLMCVVDMGSSGVQLSVYVIYMIASFVGGWVAGHKIGFKKFIWGLVAGFLYYLTICLVAAFSGGIDENGFSIQISAVLIGLGSGMLGGMLG